MPTTTPSAIDPLIQLRRQHAQLINDHHALRREYDNALKRWTQEKQARVEERRRLKDRIRRLEHHLGVREALKVT